MTTEAANELLEVAYEALNQIGRYVTTASTVRGMGQSASERDMLESFYAKAQAAIRKAEGC